MKTVIIVDDEKDVELIFRQQFRKDIKEERINLQFAFSGDEALELVNNRHQLDFVMFTDINMPGMTGLELLRKVKLIWPEAKVYVVSAYDLEEYHTSARELGAEDFLPKPFDFTIIKGKLENQNL